MRFYTNVQLIGNEFLVRGYENGDHFQIREKYCPTLFVLSQKPTKYKTLDGKYVEAIQPGYVKECREFYRKYEDVENFDIYGNNRFIYQYISDKYPEDEIKFDITKIKISTIDIEVASENGFPNVRDCAEELLTISMQDYASKKIITWGVKPFINKQENVTYIPCDGEQDLLNKFLFYWENNYPEVITGWNCSFYDIPYLCGRIDRILGERDARRISPWRLLTRGEVTLNGRSNIVYDIGGITVLDYLDLYKKFTYSNQESYRLDHIAFVELGQKKLDHSEFETFKDFYTQDWQKFVEYNIVDVELVDRLEDKMKLIELAITMAYDAKVNYTDVFSQVKMWDSIIYNYLKKQDIVIPPKVDGKKDAQYAGAYVKEPIPGKYDWVVSFDLNSLYPHLIMQYNISPETLLSHRHSSATVDKILNKELDLMDLCGQTLCANGAFYDTTKRGFLPNLMDKIYEDRVIYKKKMIEVKKEYEKTKDKNLLKEIARCNNIQMARKIQLNSAYGAIGNEYFRYYKLENAEAITLSGQVSIRWIENKLNDYLNKVLKTENKDYVIAVDTDSVYLNLGDFVSNVFSDKIPDDQTVVNFLDKVCKTKFEPYIEKCYQELAEYVNAYDQKMFMKRENIANRGIWTAKKRYILNVWDSEGVRYEEPKLKIMGLEAIKSSTPAACRTKIKEALKLIMTSTEEEVIKFIEGFRKEFSSFPIDQIAFPRTVSDAEKWKSSNSIYKKSTPIHVRGSLLFNYYIRTNKLTNKYALINNGEKIKFIFLKKANPIRENVISFIQQFPKEIVSESYIDYSLQFDKSFLDPLKSILDCIGWKTEKRGSLENFFA
jgi:DNA polymerase elongation subunit (family B)